MVSQTLLSGSIHHPLTIMAANRIPPEILRQIFSYVELTDLPSLSMANPRWYALTQELLYKDLCLFPASLTQFLRTVLTPGCDILASHVQTLTVTWQSFYAEPIDPIDLPIFRIAIQNLGLTNPLTLTNDYVALLLHLLPHVRELHLWPPDSPSTYNDYLVATNGTLPLALRSVRHLSCTWASNHRGVTRDMLLTILTLPNIETVEVHILDEIDDPYPVATNATSLISTLHISYSEISIPSLAHILLVPRARTHLSFTSTIHPVIIDLGELYSALAPVRDTLQVLELILGYRGSWATPAGPVSAHAARQSFSAWPKLGRLLCAAGGRLRHGRATSLGRVGGGDLRLGGLDTPGVVRWGGSAGVGRSGGEERGGGAGVTPGGF